MNAVYFSAAHKSSGKTTITLGLCAAYAAQGLFVAPFKKGPDYIDPMWLAMASGHACYNLDFYMMAQDEILEQFTNCAQLADFAPVEGNKGLYDGMALDGRDSNAALAKLLDIPVVLVINTNGVTRGVAPLLQGYQAFDPGIKIAGVIFNQTGGIRHEQKLRQVTEHYTDIPVLGSVRRHADLVIDERHLGLVPGNEWEEARKKIQQIREHIEQQVDLDLLLKTTAQLQTDTHRIMQVEQEIREVSQVEDTVVLTKPQIDVRIGIAHDAAFGFYYAADLEMFAQQGAELVPFSPIHDAKLPDVDGLFIGGGFPETHAEMLEQNQSLRQQIAVAIENSMPVYAECGGLMYLSRQLCWNEQCREMVGAIEGDAVMYKRPQGRGYVRFQREGEIAEIPAHEFHYSSLENISDKTQFIYTMTRGHGVDGFRDGICYKNVLASYVHQKNSRLNPWVENFVALVREQKQKKQRQNQIG